MYKQVVGFLLLSFPMFAVAVPYGYGDGLWYSMGTENPISLGSGNDLFLGYRLSALRTDNVARSEDDQQKSALVYRAGLDAGFRRDTGKNLYWAGASLTSAMHEGISQADYTDGVASAVASINRDGRHRLVTQARVQFGHDALGEDRVTGSDTSNIDRWSHTDGRINYRLGRDDTILSLDVFAEGAERDYLNNEADTDALDYSRLDAGAVFSVAYSAKTKFVFGARAAELSYKDAAAATNRDSDLYRYFAGVRWLATAKTSGEIRLGQISREITNTGAKETDFAWRALVDWKPKTYSRFRLVSDLSYDESVFTSASYIRNSAITLSWKHQWSPLWSSSMFGRYRESDYIGDTSNRVDDVYQLGASLNYKIGRKATVSPRIDYATKDSSVSAFDYNRWDIGIKLKVGL